MAIRDMSLTKLFTVFGSLVIVICIGITAFVSIWQIRADFVEKANAELDKRLKIVWEFVLAHDTNLTHSKLKLAEKIKTADIRIEEDKLFVGFYALNNDELIVDRIKDLFGGTATIFMNDVRISTNVLKDDGTRALGTKLQGVAYESVIKKGVSYRGEVDILGKKYFSAYDPIKNKSGQTIGVLYVGVPKSDYSTALNRMMIIIGIVAVILVVIVNLLLFPFIKRLTKPIVQLVPVANRLAEGDLGIDIKTEALGEIGQVLHAMRNMVEKWREVVTNVKHASDKVSSASRRLNDSAGQMSGMSSDQYQRASQVATATEEMSQTVIDIAQNITNIAESTGGTVKVARDGEVIVDRSINEVREIADTVDRSATFVKSLGERSQQIGEIVNVINDIADQTNLLALNAAIEAARAGEQGRGFAVVADEVRKLAERTATATSEIDSMIRTIQSEVNNAVAAMENVTVKVNAGVELSEHAGWSLKAIVAEADNLQIMVQQIASATEEMSATSDEISKDVERIASVSRETSHSSDETAEAATELSRLSVNLQETVDGFRF